MKTARFLHKQVSLFKRSPEMLPPPMQDPIRREAEVLSRTVARLRHLFLLLALGAPLASLLSGCQIPRPSAADTGPAQALVGGDISISAAREVFKTFEYWEKDNRAVLASSPEVREYGALIREKSGQWLAEATARRNAYAAQSTPENLRNLEVSLAALNASASDAETLMAENTWKVLPYLKEPSP